MSPIWKHQVQALQTQLATILSTGVCGVPERTLGRQWGIPHSLQRGVPFTPLLLWGRKGECQGGDCRRHGAGGRGWKTQVTSPCCAAVFNPCGPWPLWGMASRDRAALAARLPGLGAGQRRSRGQPVLNQPSRGILWGRSHAGMGELNPNV